MNTAIGALLAGLIAFVTGASALLAGEVCETIDGEQVCRSVQLLSDITPVQWMILSLGTAGGVLKDWHAIAVRRGINKVTNSNDGGGTV